jgi:DNA-binding protein YbaB
VSAEFDQLVAQFEQFQSKLKNVDEQFANLGQMQGEIADLEARASSPDRAVTVVAGPGGTIKDIQFTPQALRQPPHALSAAVMSTLQRAVAEAARKQAGIVEGHLGGDMHLMDQVLQTQAELFGTTPEELRASMEQPQTPPPAPAGGQAPPFGRQAPPPAPFGGQAPPPAPFGGQAPPPRPTPPPRSAPRRRAPEDADDYSQQSVLRRDDQPAPPLTPPRNNPQQGGFLRNLNEEDDR